MNVRLEDVAQRAGVSKATVSLALNGSPKINAKTRVLVEKLAREMGYRPNLYARKLATKKSKQIGLIVPDIALNYYASLVKHIFADLSASGYGLSVSTSMNSRLLERRIVVDMIENRMDGLLIAPMNAPNASPSYLDLLDDAGIPTLLVTAAYSGVECPCVMCDLYGGARKLTELLYRRGYRRMLFLSGPAGVHCLEMREHGYRDFIREAGLDYEQVVHLPDVWYEDAQRYILGESVLDADAVMCVNDMMALGVINALTDRGVRIPEDVAVTGYDDSLFATVSPVPITTVRQDLERMASESVDRILNMIQGVNSRDEASGALLPCEVIERRSVRQNISEQFDK